MTRFLDDIKWNDQGLVPVIAQDHQTQDILMMAWMNRESLLLTTQKNIAIYYSRSRQQLWRKGESSGHTQIVHDIRLDCDNDVIVLKIEQVGGIACHTGRRSCFYQSFNHQTEQWDTVDPVIKDPNRIYG
jgi:phosphoribosyl-AMP cyclohydrolase